MDTILYNGICVRFLRVPFVVLLFTAFVFVYGSWATCLPTTAIGSTFIGASVECTRCSNCGANYCGNKSECETDVSSCPSTQLSGGYVYVLTSASKSSACTSTETCNSCYRERYSLGVTCNYNLRCGNQCEADSVVCVNDGLSWNEDSSAECGKSCGGKCPDPTAEAACVSDGGEWRPYPDCECIYYPDTLYRCVNGSMESNTAGERPVARMYRCYENSCELTGTLNGTCQDWGLCQEGVIDCDVAPHDSLNRRPCKRSGGSYTSSSKCYYQCVDGSTKVCKPTSTEYVAGAIYAGTCPDTPPESCYPASSSSGPSSSDSGPDPFSSSAVTFDTIPADPLPDGSNLDYSGLLNAIRDTLHRANVQRESISRWDLDFLSPSLEHLDNIDDYTLNSWQTSLDIDYSLKGFQSEGFNLASDVKSDLDSARLLLDEINLFLKNDSLKTYSTDTTYNPLLRDIKGVLDSTGSMDSTYHLLKPYFSDSGQYDSPITRLINSVTDNFPSRDSSTRSMCSAYYSCVQESGLLSGFVCKNRYPNWESCMDGGTPLDGVENLLDAGLTAIVKGLFGDDSTDIPAPSDDGDTNVVLPPIYSSASVELQRANDSLGRFNIRSVVDSMRSMLDSAKRMNKDTTKIQPDSLWLDSSEARRYVEHVLLPSGTGTDCFVCHADLGTFGGLTDTSLKVHIDFSDFGGYNWCEIIRAVVRIATLVTCISLTLGSWAAAFGYNPKNDA